MIIRILSLIKLNELMMHILIFLCIKTGIPSQPKTEHTRHLVLSELELTHIYLVPIDELKPEYETSNYS